jgi:parallel beta-helix repeat protein
MAKLVLTDITGSYASVAALNANFALTETALENTLSRDGTTPNTMLADIDLNNNDLLNVRNIEAQFYKDQNGVLVAFADYTGTVASETFSGDSSTLTFAVTVTPVASSNLSVYIDGVYQQKATYTVSGSSITFSEAPPLGTNNIEIIVISSLPIGSTTADLVGYTPAGTGNVPTTVEAKLRESVSVKDFGAVGDGVTDDTAAIQAALNSGASVFLPSGTYNISSALTISTNGQEFIGQGKGKSIIKQTATNKNGIIITGNNVYVGHLQVRDIVRSSGSAEFSGVVWGAVDGTVIENVKVDTSDDSGIRCGYDLVGGVVVPSTNSKILNCEITNVVGQLGALGGGFGIEIIGAFDCTCLGNDIEGVALHGIRISGSSRCMIANNQIDNWAELGGGEGVHVSGGFSPLIPSLQNVVTGNILTLASNIASTSDRIGVYLADDAIDCVVSSNIITMSDANGYSQAGGNINGMWIRQGSGSSGVSTSRAVISNNVIKGSLYLGISASNYISQTLITDNIIRDFYAVGIQLGTGTGETVDSNISGNTIVGNPSATTAYGINNVGTLSGCVISNNIITDVGRAVELVGTINRLSLTGNTLLRVIYTGNFAYGIYVNATVADNVFISGNTISNIGAVSGDSFQYANLSAGATDKMYFYDNIIETAAASTVVAFQAGTGLIDVRYINTVQTLANDSSPSVDRITTAKTGGTTTITDFDDGVVGQELLILSDHAVTITDNASIILAGGVNYVMKASDTLTLRMINDQVWNEVSRSVN